MRIILVRELNDENDELIVILSLLKEMDLYKKITITSHGSFRVDMDNLGIIDGEVVNILD